MPDKLESDTLQEAYYDRNLAVMVLARLAQASGYDVGLKANPDDPDWPILYVELPNPHTAFLPGPQVSWHLPKDEVIGTWPEYKGKWDGHTLDTKQARMREYLEAWE